VSLWGIRDGLLFTAYSFAVASVYLSLELRLIDGMPFSKAPEPTRQNYLLPIMALGGGAIAIAVGLQYFVLFHWPVAVLVAAILLGVGAYFLTRSSLDTLESSIRFNLGILSQEAKVLYTEIDA
jgi:hypothetical protein